MARVPTSPEGASTLVPSGVRIVSGAPHAPLIARTAAWTLPPAMVDAFSLTESEVDPRKSSGFPTEVALTWNRHILVALDKSGPCLAAICESSAAQFSVFGLMNLCWTLPLTDRPASGQAFTALMMAVSRHYDRQGVQEFLTFETSNQRLPQLRALGSRGLEPAIRWLAKVSVVPAWLAYVDGHLENNTAARASDR